MKTLKRILYFIIALVVLLLILALILPKKYTVSESREYDVPVSMVYNAINDMTLQEKWNPWKSMDPEMTMEFNDIRKGAGAEYKWVGPESGNGTYKYVATEKNKSIDTEVLFEGMGDAKGRFDFEETGSGSKVTWSFFGETGFPMNLMNFIGKKMIGKSFAEGLANLEPILKERNAGNYGGFTVKQMDLEEKHYIMNRAEVEMANISQFYAQNLGALFGKAQAAGVEMAGMPSGLFFKWDEGNSKTDMAAAIPLMEAVAIDGATSYSIPAGKALTIDYYGDYSGSANAHYAMDDYMSDRGLMFDAPCVEEYVTDPSTEKDPSKWLTKIYYYYTN